jgi:hypothetical protein
MLRRVYEQIKAEQQEVRCPVDDQALAITIISALQALDPKTGSDLLILVRMRRAEFAFGYA